MIANGLIEKIRKAGYKGEIQQGVLLRTITSFQVGGLADCIFYPQGLKDLQIITTLFRDTGTRYLLLGNGTNLLASDRGVREPLINLCRGFTDIRRQGTTVMVGAGVGLPRLLRFCMANDLSGLEPLAGIPGTAGGGIRMNVGSWGVELGDRISSLMVMDHTGRIRWVKGDDVRFGYRESELSAEEIVVQGECSLHQGVASEIAERMKDFLDRKRQTQPLFQPSAGSIFKNPEGKPAGMLIEEAGLKGIRRGDAMVSPLHANFIVNIGSAQARDVLGLIDLIRERVYQRHGIRLELEVQIIGEPEMAE
jgi:UDP-N-acetylmuramate dehydrogenase